MALLLVLYLNVAVGAALAGKDLGPPPGTCLQGPEFWCKDAATAAECKKEEEDCWIREWSSLLWKGHEEKDEAGAPLIKCCICTKIVQKIKDLAGDDPDNGKIKDAIASVCEVADRFLRGTCKKFLMLFKPKLTKDLQAGVKAWDICIDLNLCRDCLRAEEEKTEGSW